jgi:hypothetical protein
VCAQTASTSTNVSVTIDTVLLLQVNEQHQIVDQGLTDAGESRLVLRHQYGVTCVAECGVIYGIAAMPLPQGVRVAVHVHSSIGESSGWQAISDDCQAVLVRDVRGAEFNFIDIEISADVQDPPLDLVKIAFVVDDLSTW